MFQHVVMLIRYLSTYRPCCLGCSAVADGVNKTVWPFNYRVITLSDGREQNNTTATATTLRYDERRRMWEVMLQTDQTRRHNDKLSRVSSRNIPSTSPEPQLPSHYGFGTCILHDASVGISIPIQSHSQRCASRTDLTGTYKAQ